MNGDDSIELLELVSERSIRLEEVVLKLLVFWVRCEPCS